MQWGEKPEEGIISVCGPGKHASTKIHGQTNDCIARPMSVLLFDSNKNQMNLWKMLHLDFS